MLSNSIEKQIAFSITQLRKVQIEKYNVSRFSYLFFSKNEVYKVRRDQIPIVTELVGTALQTMTEKEFNRGKNFFSTIYLDLFSVSLQHKQYQVLVLKRLPDNELLSSLYKNKEFGEIQYRVLVQGVNELHEKSSPVITNSILEYQNLTWTFLEKSAISVRTSLDTKIALEDKVKKLREVFMQNLDLFRLRDKAGFVLSTHGDLHAANIFISDKAYFVDPSVASPHMYEIDYLHQVADVIVDLQVSDYGIFISRLVKDIALIKLDSKAEYLLSKFYIPLRCILRVAIWRLYMSQGLISPLTANINSYLTTISKYIT